MRGFDADQVVLGFDDLLEQPWCDQYGGQILRCVDRAPSLSFATLDRTRNIDQSRGLPGS